MYAISTDIERYMGDRNEVWCTPSDLFSKLDGMYHFNLDPCCNHDNALCDKHFTKDEDGLEQDWGGYTVYMNPPYGRSIINWVRKAYSESKKPNTLIVGLLPVRTSTKWFHNYVYNKASIEFLRGRLRFSGAKMNAPFDSMIVVWGNLGDD